MAQHPNEIDLLGDPLMNFSHGQFLAYDTCEPLPGSVWNDVHVKQGFVRRSRSIAFGTIHPFGVGTVRVFHGSPISNTDYARLICVPIELPSGILHIEGPEEYPVERVVHVTPGVYKLCAAQRIVDPSSLVVDLFLEKASSAPASSTILVADDRLRQPLELLETGEAAR